VWPYIHTNFANDLGVSLNDISGNLSSVKVVEVPKKFVGKFEFTGIFLVDHKLTFGTYCVILSSCLGQEIAK